MTAIIRRMTGIVRQTAGAIRPVTSAIRQTMATVRPTAVDIRRATVDIRRVVIARQPTANGRRRTPRSRPAASTGGRMSAVRDIATTCARRDGTSARHGKRSCRPIFGNGRRSVRSIRHGEPAHRATLIGGVPASAASRSVSTARRQTRGASGLDSAVRRQGRVGWDQAMDRRRDTAVRREAIADHRKAIADNRRATADHRAAPRVNRRADSAAGRRAETSVLRFAVARAAPSSTAGGFADRAFPGEVETGSPSGNATKHNSISRRSGNQFAVRKCDKTQAHFQAKACPRA